MRLFKRLKVVTHYRVPDHVEREAVTEIAPH